MVVSLSNAAAAAAFDSTAKLAGFVFLLVSTAAALLFPVRKYLQDPTTEAKAGST